MTCYKCGGVVKAANYWRCPRCNPVDENQLRLRHKDLRGKSERASASRLYRANNKKKNPEKFVATQHLRYAVRSGKILKPSCCSRCGVECNPEGHHTDYSKHLEVIWLCRACHLLTHGKRQSSGPYSPEKNAEYGARYRRKNPAKVKETYDRYRQTPHAKELKAARQARYLAKKRESLS